MNAHKYIITYYDEVNGTNCVEDGIVLAESYSDAMRNLEDYYGADNIFSCEELVGYDFGECYVLPDGYLTDLGYRKINTECEKEGK